MYAGKVKICHPIGIAVLKDVPAVDAEYLIRCILDLLCREKLPVGQSAGKRYYRRIERDFQYFPDEGAGNIRYPVRKYAVDIVFHRGFLTLKGSTSY